MKAKAEMSYLIEPSLYFSATGEEAVGAGKC